MEITELVTPALLVDRGALERNLATMSAALPGGRLRPHVKAHKTTALARLQADAGHRGFTCATIREVEGMARAGLGADLLLANEVADARRLGKLVEEGARVTVAVDSEATIEAAAAGGAGEVMIDVDVGMPRCGCAPEDAGRLAEVARRRGLEVRGVMGYEGHAVLTVDRGERGRQVESAGEVLARAAEEVGGDVISGGGTGSFDLNGVATEIQAGSYALMDTAYGALGLPFEQALTVLSTVISVNAKGWVVVDAGLKAFGMDHGNPTVPDGKVWYCSDEHTVFSTERPLKVGDRIELLPAHVDPTVAYHEAIWLRVGSGVVDRWEVDLRGW